MKIYTVKIEVPSGSRQASFLKWLDKKLKADRMEVLEVLDEEGNSVKKEDLL